MEERSESPSLARMVCLCRRPRTRLSVQATRTQTGVFTHRQAQTRGDPEHGHRRASPSGILHGMSQQAFPHN